MRPLIRSLILFLTLALAGVSLLATVTPGAAQAVDCPPDDAPLIPGEWARVTWATALNLRPQPTLNLARLAVLRSGMLLEVLDGSVCADGFRWWNVRAGDLVGWAADGQGADRWLEARGRVALAPGSDGVERLYALDAEGAVVERADCMRPPDDYTRTTWNGQRFSERTVAMLRHAQQIYLRHPDSLYLNFEYQVVQGSYNPGVVAASFGTHDGGGAVDFSVRNPADFSVMGPQIPLLIDALRTAGFAAWLRAPDELYRGSAIHIHAIAVGDAELSPAARRQIDGPEGYLRGFNGLPVPDGDDPIADGYGEPVICQWMIDDGFGDLRGEIE